MALPMGSGPMGSGLNGSGPLAVPTVPEVDQAAYNRLASDVRVLLGLDLAQYKPAQVWRRVLSFARLNGLASAEDLTAAAKRDAALRDRFRDMLTINVSEFFRNPEAWERLRTRVLVPTLGAQRSLRVWSAGCSIGFEPYTLAMLCRETAPAAALRISATDIDPIALERAKAGKYPELQMAGVSPARRGRFFTQSGDSWEVRPELKAAVAFRRHDLLLDSYERNFDLIVCRNTVIYFTEVAKATLFQRMAQSLRPGGALFVGATEVVAGARDFGLVQLAPNLYERVSA